MICALQLNPPGQSLIFQDQIQFKVKGDGKLSYPLGSDDFEDPDGTFITQPRKYIDKLAETYKRLSMMNHQKVTRPLWAIIIIQN